MEIPVLVRRQNIFTFLAISFKFLNINTYVPGKIESYFFNKFWMGSEKCRISSKALKPMPSYILNVDHII